MAGKQIVLRELEEAIAGASVNASGGILERGPEQLVIRSEGLFTELSDIGRVAIASRSGTPVFVSDVASVQEGWVPRQGIYSRGADLDAVEGIILMRRGENPTVVLERVRARVEELNSRILPKGVRVWPFYDRTDLVQTTLRTVGHNLLEGAGLVLAVLFLFLLDLRAAVIVCTLIPLSLLSAFIYLKSRGMSANLLSMGAVDFGMIVDGGVVIVENIVRRLGEQQGYGHGYVGGAAHPHATHHGHAEMEGRIGRAVMEVARPTVIALLIIIAAYLPIFLLQRVEGRIFGPLAHTVVAALVGSLLFSITLVPVLATFAWRRPVTHRESPLLRWSAAVYQPTLRAALARPLPVLGAAVASLLLAGVLLAQRGTEFLPELNEGALYLTFTLPGNTSLTEGRRQVAHLDEIIRSFPEVETCSSQLGRPEDGTDATLANNLEFFVKLRPVSDWPRQPGGGGRTLGELIARMNRKLGAIPGLEVNYSQPIRDNVAENISGQFGQIALKIYSDDLKELQATAERCKQELAAVPGVADLGIVKSGEAPQLQLKPRRELLGRYGLSMADVQSYVSTSLGGKVVGTLWEGNRSFDVVVRLPDAARKSIEQIGALRIPTPSGAMVPLSALVDIKVGYGRASINRENGRRYVGVRMNVRGRDLGGFVHDAQSTVAAKVPLKQGTTIEWGGEFESKERAMKRLAQVVPMALIVTLALLFQAFGTLRLALLVLFNVPFALVGGAVGLALFGMPVSIAAVVGFIALVGQAALNGVLVVSAIEERRRDGAELGEAILGGAMDRLRAVLMTAALAAFGLVPAALSTAMGAETQRPIAVVIVGGTVSAALLTLVVLPVMYSLLERDHRRDEVAG